MDARKTEENLLIKLSTEEESTIVGGGYGRRYRRRYGCGYRRGYHGGYYGGYHY